MKTKNFKTFSVVCAALAAMISCKKENIVSRSSTGISNEVAKQTAIKVLDLRPGDQDGQDALVVWREDNPDYANLNNGSFGELPITAWTNGGNLVKQRVYIQFTGLSAIPRTANVSSAKLYLYGLDNSLNSPQGNSRYPGSPYDGSNKCVVAQVVDRWDESTITWNKQPGYSTSDFAFFGPSTSQWNWDTEIDVTKMVKRMVKYPRLNNGFAISLQNENIYRNMVFGASEAANENDRPRLVVEYAE